ncbi:helix-turn-helix domain-containing protein [Paraburkholderia rhizosphaerae]|uniref:helix-turn-helix domain-containing protein n=1 Tax=Paraburkholderia rhizosphaerae TaxID=480658 RepID=UPI001FB96209|nr:helix-turn-helix transcriptional regulator [Paraburkholderia rhizosphaerae]
MCRHPASPPWTPAERRVLPGLLDGLTEKQIAQKLDCSPNTTHVHIKSIYAKFNVRNRSTLTALWSQQSGICRRYLKLCTVNRTRDRRIFRPVSSCTRLRGRYAIYSPN